MRPALSFRVRLTIALLVAAVAPLALFAGVVLVLGDRLADADLLALLLVSIAVAALVAVLLASALSGSLTAPIRALTTSLDRVAAGEPTARLELPADDELARLAERQDRLAAGVARRNRQVGRIVAAVSAWDPRVGVDVLLARAGADAREAFDLIDARLVPGDPTQTPAEERVPGDPLPVRAEVRAGTESLGVLAGRAPATAAWERADQDLFDLFAGFAGVALRNAELFARVEAQNERLVALDAAKDEFLRGVSHNLQTPLARIRAYADQLADERPDRRLAIVAEQSDRLARMVRQLLTVSRIDSGLLRARPEVLALATRVRRAWEALGAEAVSFAVEDTSEGWLAVADPDLVDQVLWALLDNAVHYGAGTPITVRVALNRGPCRLRCTIEDGGPGIADDERERLFTRWARGAAGAERDGSGLGLYVSRGLVRAMDGDLVLEPSAPGRGAAFTFDLPAEPPTEG
jgi:signal transduction histidine kinase/HAMP domain-containing protein